MSVEKQVEEKNSSLWRVLFEPNSTITDVGERARARFSAILSLVVGVFYFIGATGSFWGGHNLANVAVLIIVSLISLIAYITSRGKNYKIGSAFLVSAISISAYFFIFAGGDNPFVSLFSSLPIALILCSFLLPTRWMIILIVFNAISIPILPLFVSDFTGINALVVTVIISIIGLMLILTAVIRERVEQKRLTEITAVNTALQMLRQDLEKQVNERTQQVRVAAEIAQSFSSAVTIADLLMKTVELIVARFGYYNASIFITDKINNTTLLRAAAGENANELIQKNMRISLETPSIVSWVINNKTPKIVSDTSSEPLHMKEILLPNTRAEVCVPIMYNEQALGALDIQSATLNAFTDETVALMYTLARQIALSIQNVGSIETTQGYLLSASYAFRTSTQIASAQSEPDLYAALKNVFIDTPFDIIFLLSSEKGMDILVRPGETRMGTTQDVQNHLDVLPSELYDYFNNALFAGKIGDIPGLPISLKKLCRQAGYINIGLIPINRAGALAALLILGNRLEEPLTLEMVQPYTGIAELVVSSTERLSAEKTMETRLREIESISETSQAVSTTSDLSVLFMILHEHIQKKMGDINFLVALYDENTNSINIPYLYEKGQGTQNIESFPLGEGLTSVLIHTKEPLIIVEDTEQKAKELGAKIVGQPAKSWLGTPLINAGNVLGALIVQDTENEHAFNSNDLRYLSTLASQVAGAINNARLLHNTQTRTIQIQTASEIARDISGLLDLNELLSKAVVLIRERFNFYHSAIFLVDPSGDYAVIKEATGDAGAQMKRANHKLRVGSKSIVGFVTGSGDYLVVNDTTHDATYYANPLLPATKSEVAIPLKVGTRVLGALDVQSEKSYAFSKEDIDVLQILADQLAVAVLNSELFAETQEHLSQHRLLHHVTTAAASGTTLDEALSSAAQGLQVTLGGDRVAIMLTNRDKQTLQVKAIAGYSEEVKQIEIPMGEGITGWVAVHRQALRIDDVTKDERYIQAGANIRSELAIPMTYRGEILGVLDVESDKPSAYSENDEELLGTLGGSLAAIIANARLLDQIRRQADRERLLFEVTSKIRRAPDIQTILSTTTTELSKALGARKAEIQIDPTGGNIMGIDKKGNEA